MWVPSRPTGALREGGRSGRPVHGIRKGTGGREQSGPHPGKPALAGRRGGLAPTCSSERHHLPVYVRGGSLPRPVGPPTSTHPYRRPLAQAAPPPFCPQLAAATCAPCGSHKEIKGPGWHSHWPRSDRPPPAKNRPEQDAVRSPRHGDTRHGAGGPGQRGSRMGTGAVRTQGPAPGEEG